MRTPVRSVVLAFVCLLALAGPGWTQQVVLTGRGDADLDERIRRFLANPATRILPDTLIGRADTVRGPVAAIGVTVRVEGVIEDDLLIVDANVFVRPFGVVRGTVLNVAGGFYPSEYARVEGVVSDRGDAPYDVERTAEGFRIVGLVRRHVVDPDGLRGLRLPTYDRVAGLTVGLGGAWYPTRPGRVEPRLRAWGGWAFEREDWVGGASFAVLGARTAFEVGADRVTATPQGWIRSDLLNSLGVAANGSDYRDYYAAERYWAALTREIGDVRLRLTGALEDATSLPASRVWSVVRPDSVRTNPAIDEGRIASASLDADLAVGSEGVTADFDLTLEAGARVASGDFRFARYAGGIKLAAGAFANHTVEVRARLQGPLPGTDSLPRQRHGLLGGLETLETVPVGTFRGDRLALVRTTYAVPLDPFRVPFLGHPVVELVHAAGAAWTRGGSSNLSQALGLRLRFPLVFAFAFLDPEGERDATFGVGVQLRRRYPWEVPPL